MTRPRLSISTLSLGLVLLVCVACAPSQARSITPTPNYRALETQVAAKLAGTLTAKAPPTATRTVTETPAPATATAIPSPSPTLVPSPQPSPVLTGPLLAYARVAQDQAANIVLYDLIQQKEEMLTHFLEPQNLSDITWTRDGEWIVFVSGHDYIHSRQNDRNVFIMHPDGTELRMITGEYVDPSTAPGPYVKLKGQVNGAQGSCRVCAQGAANPVETDASGAFELEGVPISAKWARAVCQKDGTVLQGDVELAIQGQEFVPATIQVEAKGRGWCQASVSRDGQTIVGTLYGWTLNAEGKRQTVNKGVLVKLDGTPLAELQLPADTALADVYWSPVADEIVGGLASDEKTWIWRWDAQGTSLGALIEFANPSQEILSASHPALSPDGSKLVFSLRHWAWWNENKYRTELIAADANGQNARTLVSTDWGTDALHPTWSADGSTIYYQISTGAPEDDRPVKDNGNILSVPFTGEATPAPLTQDGISYMPSARP